MTLFAPDTIDEARRSGIEAAEVLGVARLDVRTSRGARVVRSSRLVVWRDAALTAAAFSLVSAFVIGLGPFGGAGASRLAPGIERGGPVVAQGAVPPRFAGLSR